MKKNLLLIVSAITIIAILQSSTKATKSLLHASGSSIKATYYTSGCTSCHGKALPGGSITLIGLPSVVVTGQSYTIGVHLNDATTNGKNWGFIMSTTLGTFTSTNPFVGVTSGKMCYHKTPPIVTDTAYTFDSIVWKAPDTACVVTMKYSGIAGNHNGSKDAGDYSYIGTNSVTVAVPTPIKFASFNATLTSNRANLNWTSASEINVACFNIEKSGDGNNYVLAGSIKAIGNSSTVQNYSFSDDLNSLNRNIYYRIKAIDKSGAITYSDVKLVSVNTNENNIVVYPNPLRSGQDLKVKYESSKIGRVSFSLFNAEGKRMTNTILSVNEGTNDLSLNVGHLTSGTYYLSTNLSNSKRIPIIIR